MPRHPRVKSINSFKGLNNVLRPENTPQDYLKEALNVNIDKQGKLSKRKGYSKVDSGVYSTIWTNDTYTKCYVVKDGDLMSLNPDYSLTLIRSSVGSIPLSFEEIDDIVYYSNSQVNGIIENNITRSWGINPPPSMPVYSLGYGGLQEGDYQISYSYVDEYGRESGTNLASVATLTSNSSIIINSPSPQDGIVGYRVYSSKTNGSTQYFYREYPIGVNCTLSDTSSLFTPLRMFNKDPAPLGSIIKYYRGRIYIAQGNILWYSEPNQYEHFTYDENYFEFPDDIVSIMPVEDGIWIGSDHVYYLSGIAPDSFKRTLKERVEVVSGTESLISGSYIQLDNTPIGYKWLVTTNLGVFVLFNQGVIINLTATNLSLERAKSGTSLFLQDEGMNQYLSILNKNNRLNNSSVGDVVTTSVIRNGIKIS